MDSRLKELKRSIRNCEHGKFRQAAAPDITTECDREGLSWPRRAARLTRRMCEAEQPVILPGERIVFTRTVKTVPPVYGPDSWQHMVQGRVLHELGPISNICADWEMLLAQGLAGRKAAALAARAKMGADAAAVEFLDAAVETIDAVLALAERYARAAAALGREDIADVLRRVPAKPAGSFREALQSVRLCHAVLWMSGHYHCGLGRFDQYMWPYLGADLAAGRLTTGAAEELLAEFFISLNKDSDLYPGVQQGDNGQSLMLGGVKRDGTDAVNELTKMALRVARDVAMIDPKINLRVTKETDIELLVLATELTRLGLGFPQYSNDEVVIPALAAHGYDLEDARDYTVAACWEFIIPGRGMEVVNIGAVSMPAAVDRAVREGLAIHDGFEGIMSRVRRDLGEQLSSLTDAYSRLLLPPAPYYSVFMHGCLEKGADLSRGLKYNNFGVHGACSANAADALANVKILVFDDGAVKPDELLDALASNYEKSGDLRRKLVESDRKVGNNDPGPDSLLADLFDMFAGVCEAVADNGRGGRIRPGSGSAMYYAWLARGHTGMREPVVGATADGRRAGDLFSANLAPAPNIVPCGPVSILQSFSKIGYSRICNGGPITMELSDTVFRNEESIRKVACLVRTFAQLGCQQLQVNALNAETLKQAKLQPEQHRNLIVRVWGWSGYFCELDEVYQDHIIARHMHLQS